jgi:hypothetical protein
MFRAKFIMPLFLSHSLNMVGLFVFCLLVVLVELGFELKVAEQVLY